MIGMLVAAGLLAGAALLVGQALCILARGAPAAYGGAIGLAALLVAARIAIELPGRATTAVVILALLTVAAGVVVARSGAGVPGTTSIAVAVLATIGACVPFLANGRVGLPGVSFNNDTSLHLLWAEGLRDARVESLAPSPGSYPLGPHALVASLAQATGIDMDLVLTALLVVVPVLTALAALAALGELPRVGRVVVALTAGFAYLVSSYYVEGAFKETIVAAMALTFAVVLQDVASRGVRPRHAVLLAFPVAGALVTFSYGGAAWPALTVAIWLVLDAIAHVVQGGWPSLRARVRTLLPAAGLAVAALVVLVAAELPNLLDFLRAAGGAGGATSAGISATNLGNLAGPLPLAEAFGIWLSPDFRVAPPTTSALDTGLLAAIAIAATVFGVLSLARRGELALPAALGAAALVYLRSKGAGDSPYVTAKALVIAAPLILLVAGAGLWRPIAGLGRWSEVNLARALLIAVLTLAAGASSFSALRGAQVGPSAHKDELAALAPTLGRSPTLFLGNDDFYAWKLRGVPAAQPAIAAPLVVDLRAEKPWSYGQPFDFDSVEPATLDRFTYVITPRTAYASEPPANFRRVRETRSFVVWRRQGPTEPRETLPTEVGTPGAMLDCRTPEGRALARRDGEARVMDPPVSNSGPPGPLLPGGGAALPFKLPRGRWALSMPYMGPQAVTVELPGLRTTLPANLDRPGPTWALGEVAVTSDRPMTLRISIASGSPSKLHSRTHLAYVGNIMATRVGNARESVPLADACGRYVDWYRLGA